LTSINFSLIYGNTNNKLDTMAMFSFYSEGDQNNSLDEKYAKLEL